MRMRRGVGAPAAKQYSLLRDGEGAATKSPVALGRDASRRVDEHQTAIAGKPEELAQHSQASRTVVRQLARKLLNVTTSTRPNLVCRVGYPGTSEIAHGRQRGVDGSVDAGRVPALRARTRARNMDSAKTATAAASRLVRRQSAACAVPRRAARSWSVAIARPPWVKNVSSDLPVGPTSGRVCGRGRASVRVIGLFVYEQPSQSGDQHAARAGQWAAR